MKIIVPQKKEFVHQGLLEDIIFQIKNGLLKADDYLPSENALAQQYRISRMSVRLALNELVKKNFIEKHPGKGTIIKKNSSSVGKKEQRCLVSSHLIK